MVDKPTGLTSHDVVDRIRRLLKLKKVGHAGTLDPMATGLLIILVGRATKVSQFLMSLSKEYSGTILLGVETDSHDIEGETVAEAPIPEDLTADQVQEVLATFRGDQYQLPPMFSAKKVKGVPLYKHARKGQEVEREARVIHVSRFEQTGFRPPEVDFFCAVSKGTYVRTLAHDAGVKLGCGGCLNALRRTRIDRFAIEKATPLDDMNEMSYSEIVSRLIPVAQAVPSHVLS